MKRAADVTGDRSGPTRVATARQRRGVGVLAVSVLMLLTAGCLRGPQWVPEAQRATADRALVEWPSGYRLEEVVRGLTAPSAIAFDGEGNLILAESGLATDGGTGGAEPRLTVFRRDGTSLVVYPLSSLEVGGVRLNPQRWGAFKMHGPVGGIAWHDGRVLVSHRDELGRGMISAFSYDGTRTTVVADLPAEGDFGVTDLAVSSAGRLYFGVGAATNSGVVGLDNWQSGWVARHRDVCDLPAVDLKLLGYRYDSPNPGRGWFGSELAVTAPFQPFGVARELRVLRAPNSRPGAAVYSVSPLGGDVRVEAHGIRHPRGLAFNEFGRLFIVNNGMELRGTRPVRDDPDAVLRFVPGVWYGWPDYTADFDPVTDAAHQPPEPLVSKHGYPENANVIDAAASKLVKPDRNALLHAALPTGAGAAKLAFVPPVGPFQDYRGSVIVALSGDRGPWAHGGKPLDPPTGFRVVQITESKQVSDLIRNVRPGPISARRDVPRGVGRGLGLERPADVKFGPDGMLYIVDLGRVDWRQGRPRVVERTGRVWRLVRLSPAAPSTQP